MHADRRGLARARISVSDRPGLRIVAGEIEKSLSEAIEVSRLTGVTSKDAQRPAILFGSCDRNGPSFACHFPSSSGRHEGADWLDYALASDGSFPSQLFGAGVVHRRFKDSCGLERANCI